MSFDNVRIRPADERGSVDFGWLSTRHTFSFGNYYDPEHLGFRALRVINDDRVRAGRGFGTHPHRDMEILSVVVEGALQHRDSLGSGSIIVPGEIQRMSAGTGILHSEFNPSQSEALRFLQIWIEPERKGLPPSYEQRSFPMAECPDHWILVGSRNGRDGSLTIHQDVDLWRASVGLDVTLERSVAAGRHVWLQVVTGSVEAAGQSLREGDGAALTDPGTVAVRGLSPISDVLLFDLA